jgi:hypothetical protein
MLKNDKLSQILMMLDAMQFIEILDQTDTNVFFRFSDPFTRDIIYQRLIYQQRRLIHHLAADAMQTLPRNELSIYEVIIIEKYYLF